MQTFDAVDRQSGYYPPVVPGVAAPGTTYTHDLDRKPTLTTRPDGAVLERVYDAAGRLDLVTTPEGTWDHEYFGLTPCPGCAPGKLSRLTSPSAVALDFTYDGRLTTSATWSGAVAGQIAWGYDADFREIAVSVTAGSTTSTVHRSYDADSLVICASPSTCTPAGTDALVVTWSTQLPRPERADLGPTREAYTYDAFGAPARLTGTHGGATLYSETMATASYPRDPLGRIQRRVDAQAGRTATWDYEYDPRGRLSRVVKDGVAVEENLYDPNGNRVSVTRPGGVTTATYDAQDRMLTWGEYAHTYTANGELRTKTHVPSATTTKYTYDARGNLVRVALPGGDVLEYLIDGRDRRVGKLRNGALERAWLWKDQLRLAAELDASGAMIARFVYGYAFTLLARTPRDLPRRLRISCGPLLEYLSTLRCGPLKSNAGPEALRASSRQLSRRPT